MSIWYKTASGNEITDWELESQYEEMVNENYPVVTIQGQEFSQGTALKRLDPTAFRGSFLDYIDAKEKSGELEEI